MLKYGRNFVYNPDSFDNLNIDKQSLNLIPNGSSVLEIGCATGFMGEYLKKKKNCRVVGVDIGKDEIKIASKVLDKVLWGNIEEGITLRRINNKFDVILASAVIEHLKNPEESLIKWRKLLKNSGFIVITTSNISHWTMRIKFLFGNFDYQEYGILDNTHLRFYNTKTFKKLIENSGYKIKYFSIDSIGGGYPRISKFLSKFFPNLFAYQMVIKAMPK